MNTLATNPLRLHRNRSRPLQKKTDTKLDRVWSLFPFCRIDNDFRNKSRFWEWARSAPVIGAFLKDVLHPNNKIETAYCASRGLSGAEGLVTF